GRRGHGQRGGGAGGSLARRASAGRRYLGRAAVHGDRVPARLLPQLSPVPAGVSGDGPRQVRGRYVMTAETAGPGRAPGSPSGEGPRVADVAPGSGRGVAGGAGRVVVCAPLLPEARAVRPGIGEGGDVRVSGYGPGRARRQAERLRQDTFGALVVAGTGGGLTDDLRPGDLVVASDVTDGTTATACPSAPLLAGELRRAGLPASTGPVVSVDRLAHGRERARQGEPGGPGGRLEAAWAGPRHLRPLAAAAAQPGRAGRRPARAALPAGGRAGSGPVGRGGGPAAAPARRAAVVLRRGRPGDRDRREGARAAGPPGVRAQAD